MLHILFVCTGNTCRSPMAKAIYAEKSVQYGINSIFSSAAIGFGDGIVSPNAVTVCNEIGIDISNHQPRIIRERDINITDIFVVMTKGHADTLTSILDVPKSKIYILGGGIPDPFGSDLITYRQCRKRIEESIDELCIIIKTKLDNGSLRINENDKSYIKADGV